MYEDLKITLDYSGMKEGSAPSVTVSALKEGEAFQGALERASQDLLAVAQGRATFQSKTPIKCYRVVEEPQYFQDSPGSHITGTIRRAIKKASESGEVVHCKFNDTVFQVGPDTTIEEAQRIWELTREVDSHNYRLTPAYAEAVRKRAITLKQMQDKVNILMRELETLGPNLKPIIAWWRDFAEAADHTDVRWDRDKVLTAFAEAGFTAGAYTGKDFVRGDKEIEARYIIGQCLDGVGTIGSPHPLVIKFANDWIEQYR